MRAWCACVLALGALAQPGPAAACTRLSGLTMGAPSDGATGVPTDVVPWLRGFVTGTDVRIELAGPDGMPIPVNIERFEGGLATSFFEIRPEGELLPRTTYAIQIFGTGPSPADGGVEPNEVYRFATGDGPSTGTPPSLGRVAMQVIDKQVDSSCGDNTVACLGHPEVESLRATVFQEDGTVEAQLLSFGSGLSYSRPESSTAEPFCIELRARDLAGRLGSPSRACSEDARTFEVRTASPVGCDDGRLVLDGDFVDETFEDVGSCSAGGRASGSPWAAVLVALVLARRRARAR